MSRITSFRTQDHFLFISYKDRDMRISFKNAGCWVKQHRGKNDNRWIPSEPENLWSSHISEILKKDRNTLMAALPGRINFIIDLFPADLRWTVLKRLSPWHDELSLKTFFVALHANPVLFMCLLTADKIKADLDEEYFSPLLFLMDRADQLAVFGLPRSLNAVKILEGISPDDFSIELMRQIRMDTLINNRHKDPGYKYKMSIAGQIYKQKAPENQKADRICMAGTL